MTVLVDIAVNLTSERFASDRADVIARAREAGVGQLLITGSNLHESRLAAALAAEQPDMLFSTAGIHPHDAKDAPTDYAAQLTQLAQQAPSVVAIGECGLDFNRDFSPRPVQEQVFEQQLELAVTLQKPVLMHCRDAHERFIAIVKQYRDALPGAVLHCFTGSRQELFDCLDWDLHIGITGWVCDERRGQALADLVPQIPAPRLLLETDAPYLTPRDVKPKPKKGRNEPALLAHIAQRVALLRGESFQALAAGTTANARQLFNLPGA